MPATRRRHRASAGDGCGVLLFKSCWRRSESAHRRRGDRSGANGPYQSWLTVGAARPPGSLLGTVSGPDAVVAEPPEAVIEGPGTSATRRKPARIEGKHGAELNLQVLHRRRTPHRAGHECRTNILPISAFVYAAFATTGRASGGLAVSSCAQGAGSRRSSAAVATAARFTAAPSAHSKRARRRSMPPRSATRGVLVASGAGPIAHAAIGGGKEK